MQNPPPVAGFCVDRYTHAMTLHQLLAKWSPRFAGLFSPRERAIADLEAELLLAHVLKCDRSHVIAHETDEMDPQAVRAFERLAKRRLAHEPMAYLLGRREFYGREFLTDKRALIPRPETELLIDRALAILNPHPSDTLVWDVGTGSGAIATTMALEEPRATVIASDVDPKALALARKNVRKFKVKVKFVQEDLLGLSVQKLLRESPARRLLILANLPYLPLSDKKILDPDVTKYEPSSALFTKENGLHLIHKLLEQLSGFRTKTRTYLTILLEFDPPQVSALTALVKKYFPVARIAIHQDLCGRDRVCEVRMGNDS